MSQNWGGKGIPRLCRSFTRPGRERLANEMCRCLGCSGGQQQDCGQQTAQAIAKADAAWSSLYGVVEDLLIGAAITIGIGLVLRLIPASFTFDIIEFLFPKAFNLIRRTGFNEGVAEAVKNAGPGSSIFSDLIGGVKQATRSFIAETAPEFASLLTKVR